MLRGSKVLAMLALAVVLSACSGDVTATSGGVAPASDGGGAVGDQQGWVVVTFAVSDDDPSMMKLLPTEDSADAALQQAGLGHIDGNEVGQGVYDMYFVGDDARAMWAVLEPIVGGAPVPWEKVELRAGIDDPDPTVLTR